MGIRVSTKGRDSQTDSKFESPKTKKARAKSMGLVES